VAVLIGGRLEQCDRPEVLYWSPQSRYVAEFVTQANFLAAERTAEGWKTEIGLLPADFKADSLDRGEIMVRQEDCTLVPDATSAVTVRGRQFLGREAIYCLQLPSGREMHIRRPDGDRLLAARTPVRLVLKPNKCLRCFPSGSEQR
jgi:iron(III) transport system ATP-binding protein